MPEKRCRLYRTNGVGSNKLVVDAICFYKMSRPFYLKCIKKPTLTTAKFTLVVTFLILGMSCFSQSKLDSLLGKLDPQKLAASISQKAEKMEEALVKKSLKTLSSMQKQEEKIYKKLLKGKDSLQAKASLTGIKEKYKGLQDKLKNPAIVSKAKQYIPKLDSLTTSLKLLDANGVGGKVKDALSKTQALQDKFQQAEEIKKFIKERKEQLKAQLEKLGMLKQLKQINKQVYYYAAQIKEYKEILKDPRKIEKKALALLSQTKIWKDFFKKNSMLASLFRMQPDDLTDPAYLASLAGLQTRAQVNGLIQQQIQSAGPNAMQQFQQQMQSAQSQLNALKDKLLKKMPGGGGNSSDDIMPEGFKPNTEKAKSFLNRLEYSATMQSQKSTNFFPTTSDIGLTVGYKPNQKSVIGIGATYKVGLGRGWDKIKITHEGIGLKSFADIKLKGSFWISGGYEQNYRSAFNSIAMLQNYSAWSKSGLVGISKVVKVKSKFFKKTKAQVLWDFLSYQQVPRTQPLIFRINYNIK
jgi:hypothetical protein